MPIGYDVERSTVSVYGPLFGLSMGPGQARAKQDYGRPLEREMGWVTWVTHPKLLVGSEKETGAREKKRKMRDLGFHQPPLFFFSIDLEAIIH